MIIKNVLCNIADPQSIAVGVMAEPGDPSIRNYIDPSSDFYDDEHSNPKFGVMKKLSSGSIVGPVDEGKKIRLVCRAGRSRPIPQVTWWQYGRGQIYDSDLGNIFKLKTLESSFFLGVLIKSSLLS